METTGSSTLPVDGRTNYLVTDAEGYVYDNESGEVHAVPGPDGEPIWIDEEQRQAQPEADRFEIQSAEAADWVLKLKMSEEAALLAIDAQRAAIVANLEGRAVAHRNRLKSLGHRFDNELETFARKELAGRHGGGKTLKLAFGQIAFRQSKGSAEITDPSAALAYVREWAPEKIVPKPVGVEAVKAAIDAELAERGEEEPADTSGFFRQAQPRESCAIKTNLGK